MKKAADAGSREACHALSECYEFGLEGISPDEMAKKSWQLEGRKAGNNIRNTSSNTSTGRRNRRKTNTQNSNSGSSSSEDDENDDVPAKELPLIARRDSVAAAATLAGWREADEADQEMAEKAMEDERIKKKQTLQRLTAAATPTAPEAPAAKEIETQHVPTTKTRKIETQHVMAVPVDLEKAQYYCVRGSMIGDAIRNGTLLQVKDGLSFAIASPTPPETTKAKDARENKERKKERKNKRKGESGRRRRMSKYVKQILPSSSISSVVSHSNSRTNGGRPSITTPRVSARNSTHADRTMATTQQQHALNKANKSSKPGKPGKPRKLPIPPLPMPIQLPRTSGWSEDHEQWQGPQGPGIPGFGMSVYHSFVSVNQGALVPAAKSSVFPFGGNTVES